MRTYETKTETREFNVLKSIICDRCEKEIELVLDYCMKGVDLSIGAGYGSRHDLLASDHNLNFEICDECCEEFLKSF